MKNFMKGKVILITGGTGSLGQELSRVIFKSCKPKKVIIFSRDEFKQHEMAKVFPEDKYPIRYFLGDVRDRSRLCRAFEGVDYVVHAAALKQVPALEYNPTEAVKTNVLGADNVVNAAIDKDVTRVIAVSTDKAVNPINLYGATKLVSEKIFIAANAYSGSKVRFSVVRYGNVVGSRGSVIPLFCDLKKRGVTVFPVTDLEMTRFWITLEQGVSLVLKALTDASGGELFVPNIPSLKIVDLARAIEPKCTLKIIGIRPGEKIHETLISEDEARKTKMVDGIFVVLPQFYESQNVHKKYVQYSFVPKGFVYRSDTNSRWLSVEELRCMLQDLGKHNLMMG